MHEKKYFTTLLLGRMECHREFQIYNNVTTIPNVKKVWTKNCDVVLYFDCVLFALLGASLCLINKT